MCNNVTKPIVVRLDGVYRQRCNQAIHGFQLVVLECQAAAGGGEEAMGRESKIIRVSAVQQQQVLAAGTIFHCILHLSGTDWGVVRGMREKNRPLLCKNHNRAIKNARENHPSVQRQASPQKVWNGTYFPYLSLFPFMKRIPMSMRRIAREIRNNVTKTKASIGRTFRVQAHVQFGSRLCRWREKRENRSTGEMGFVRIGLAHTYTHTT